MPLPRADLRLQLVIIVKFDKTAGPGDEEAMNAVRAAIESNGEDDMLATVKARWELDPFEIDANFAYGLSDESLDEQTRTQYEPDGFTAIAGYNSRLGSQRYRVYFCFSGA